LREQNSGKEYMVFMSVFRREAKNRKGRENKKKISSGMEKREENEKS